MNYKEISEHFEQLKKELEEKEKEKEKFKNKLESSKQENIENRNLVLLDLFRLVINKKSKQEDFINYHRNIKIKASKRESIKANYYQINSDEETDNNIFKV